MPTPTDPDQALDFETGDQTSFSHDAELWQQKSAPVPKKVEPVVDVQPVKKNPPKILIISGGALIFLIIILGFVALAQQKQVIVPPEGISQSIQTTPEQDNLIIKIEQLKTELSDADPTKSEYPFPPISFELRLDPQTSP